MALGKRKNEQQEELFITAERMPRSPGHVFYQKVNRLLADGGFDRWVEDLCEPFYSDGRGRPGIPPGVYFRMLLVGYFEGIGSQRSIAWRCADSLSLREFLGIPLGEDSPDHSSLSVIRIRLPLEVHREVFVWFVRLAQEKKLVQGKTVAVDSTTLEANAAMKSIVRRDTGEDWNEYLTRLMQEEGVVAEDESPSDDERRRFDKQRKNRLIRLNRARGCEMGNMRILIGVTSSAPSRRNPHVVPSMVVSDLSLPRLPRDQGPDGRAVQILSPRLFSETSPSTRTSKGFLLECQAFPAFRASSIRVRLDQSIFCELSQGLETVEGLRFKRRDPRRANASARVVVAGQSPTRLVE